MSYDYGIGTGSYWSDYVRVRYQKNIPITLRAFLMDYFNITE